MQTVTSTEEEFGSHRSSEAKRNEAALTRKSSACGKMTLYVKSRKKYMGTQLVSLPLFLPGNPVLLIKEPRRIPMYQEYLDDEQSEALKNSIVLADNLCLSLEVRDVAHLNPFTRLLGVFFRNRVVPKAPSLSFADTGLVSLISSKYSKIETSY